MKKTKAIITGGGIGGLAAALALDKVGLDYVVLEQAPQISEVGAGVSIWSNGVRALRELGLEDSFHEKTLPADGVSVQDHKGRVIIARNFADSKKQRGVSVSTIYRPDLINLLLRPLPSEKIYLNSRVQSFKEDTKGITVKLTSGKEFHGDIVIGADGIHSTVRKILHQDKSPRYVGYTCWRGLLTMDQDPPTKNMGFLGMGPGSQCGFAWLKNRKIYWFAVVWSEPDSSKNLNLSSLKKAFSGWSGPIREMIDRTPPAAIIRGDIRDFAPIKYWGRGAVTLLGDAAHASTPNLAQGACMALEDAVELAYALKNSKDVKQALRLFEKRRYKRTAHVVRDSRYFGEVSLRSNPLLVRIRNLMARRSSSFWLKKYTSYSVPTLS